ncbi:unnamed protein product, partial [Ixodes persulcatus]
MPPTTKEYRDASVSPQHSPSRSSRYSSREKLRRPHQASRCARRRQGDPKPYTLAATVSALLAVAVCIIMFVWALTSNYTTLFVAPTAKDKLPCCASQIKLARLNPSENPCRHFSNYVCSEEKRDKAEFRWTTWNPTEALLQSSAHPEAYAGGLLSRLRTMCHAALEGRESIFITELTEAVLRSVPALRVTLTSTSQVMATMFHFSVQLRLLPIVTIKVVTRNQRNLGKKERS